MCTECGAAFTTTESVDLSKSIVFKNLKRMEPFLRDKLFLSVNDSLRHRKTHLEDSTALTDTIIAQCLDASDTAGQIERTLLVKTTITVLERFDTAAATSYRAFHKDAL